MRRDFWREDSMDRTLLWSRRQWLRRLLRFEIVLFSNISRGDYRLSNAKRQKWCSPCVFLYTCEARLGPTQTLATASHDYGLQLLSGCRSYRRQLWRAARGRNECEREVRYVYLLRSHCGRAPPIATAFGLNEALQLHLLQFG